jgi:hypothetical protein
MWITIIVVLSTNPVFQGTASPQTGDIGAGVFEAKAACEQDLIAYVEQFEGQGEASVELTKNEWGNYRVTEEYEKDQLIQEIRYCMQVHSAER